MATQSNVLTFALDVLTAMFEKLSLVSHFVPSFAAMACWLWVHVNRTTLEPAAEYTASVCPIYRVMSVAEHEKALTEAQRELSDAEERVKELDTILYKMGMSSMV